MRGVTFSTGSRKRTTKTTADTEVGTVVVFNWLQLNDYLRSIPIARSPEIGSNGWVGFPDNKRERPKNK